MHTRAKTRHHARLLAVKDCAERKSSPHEVQPATATRRGARVMRAWLISASAVLLGSAGHTLAGGGAAHPMILALCTALGALAALGLLALLERITRSRQRAIYLGTAAGALTVQTLLHGVFNLSHGSAQAAHRVAAIAPDCRERELAITHLEQSLSWAIAAIVRPSQVAADGVA